MLVLVMSNTFQFSAARTSSALPDKRKDTVVSKITSSIAAKLTSRGVSVTSEVMQDIYSRVARLYATIPSSQQLTRTPSPQVVRPASTASMRSPSPQSLIGVSQRDLDELMSVLIQEYASVNTSSSAEPSNPNADALPLTMPLLPREQPSIPPISREMIQQQAHLTSPTPEYSPQSILAHIPPHLLSRSASSLRQSAESILSQMSDCGFSPHSKRLRRLIRDSDAYQQAMDKAAAEKRDAEAKKIQRANNTAQFRSTLDSQVRERELLRQIEMMEKREEKSEAEKSVARFHSDILEARLQKRRLLEHQKEANLQMLAEKQQRDMEEKRHKYEEEATEVEAFVTAAEQDRAMQAARKCCQSAQLSDELKNVTQQRQTAARKRIEELRDAKRHQAKLSMILDEQEAKRQAQKDKVAQKICLSEQRAQRQLNILVTSPSVDQKKSAWLEQKLAREANELAEIAAKRQARENAEREASQNKLKLTLIQQMQEHARQQVNAKELDRQLAASIRHGLECQAARDDFRKFIRNVETSEWLHVLDAQRKFKDFLDTKDIITSISRGNEHFSPSRSLTATSDCNEDCF